MTLPLTGIRILEVTRVLAGPYCGMLLADMGADVIKVEMPGRGDEARYIGPFTGGQSAYFMSVNRNKKSLTLDLKNGRGQEIFKQLAAFSDVLIENNRPHFMAGLGLDYPSLKEHNPRLIYASITGYGHSGPYKDKGAFDINAQSLGGIMSITGQPEGTPTRVGSSIGDLAAGLFASLGITAALQARGKSGHGQHVDVSMLDCQVALVENAIARYFATGQVPVPIGNRHPSVAPFTSMPTADGDVIVAAWNDHLWVELCKHLGDPELAKDPRFHTNQDRLQNWTQLCPLLEELFRQKTTGEWIPQLSRSKIPCNPINNIAQVITDPQVRARQMIVEIEHPDAGNLHLTNFPLQFSASGTDFIREPSPTLGQHSRQILKDQLNFTDEQIDALAREEVI